MTLTRRGLATLKTIARRVPGAMPVLRWLHRRLDPRLRAIDRTRRRHGEALFQPFPDTFDERYPALFDALATRLAHLGEPRILSFGCSSGAEVRALRRRLPAAHIVGIDANARAIAAARRADGDPRSTYRNDSRVAPGQRFDAVLALAVFRHGVLEAEHPASCAEVLPFARFAAGVAMLDAVLVPGGWLAIGNAHFRFTDTPAARRYTADGLRPAELRPTVLYDAGSRRLPDAEPIPVLFRKEAVPARGSG